MALPHNLPARFPPVPLPEAGAPADHEPNPAAALLLQGARPGNGAHFGPNNEFLPSSHEVVDRQFYNSLNRVRLLGDRANALISQSYNFRRRLMDKIQRMRRLVYFMRAVVTKIQAAIEHGGDGAGDAAAAACRAEIADALAAERRGVIEALDPLSENLLRSLVDLLQHPGLNVDDILAALQDAIAAWNTEVQRLVTMLPADQQNAAAAPATPPGDAGMAAQWTAAGPAGENAGQPLGPQAPDIRGDDELHGNIGAAEVATRAPYPYAPPPASGDANYAYQRGAVLPRPDEATRRAQFRAEMAARAAAAPGVPPPAAGVPAPGVQHAGPPDPAAAAAFRAAGSGGQQGGWTPTGVRRRKSRRKKHGKKKRKTKHKKKRKHKTRRRKHRRRRRRTKHHR